MEKQKNLMLKKEVIEAVENRKFKVYSIDNIEDGIEVLTGMPAGELQPDSNYPAGTFNFLVAEKLKEFSKALKGDKKQKDDNDEESEK